MKNLFLFLFLSLSFYLRTEIIPIDTLTPFCKALENSNQDTLVLFDVDGTLIIPCDKILHPANLHKMYAFIKSNATKGHDISFLSSKVMTTMQFTLVDQQFPKIIKELHDKKIPTIALTAMNTGALGIIPRLEEWRFAQLLTFDIDFRAAFSKISDLSSQKLEDLQNKPGFYKGILFSGHVPKGKVLVSFLKTIQWTPKKVLFIDDNYEFLVSVQQALRREKIPFMGFHYQGSSFTSLFHLDEHLANYQLQYLLDHGIWLSDEKAVLPEN